MSIENKNPVEQSPDNNEQNQQGPETQRLLGGIALGEHLLPASASETPGLIDKVPGFDEASTAEQAVDVAEKPELIDTVPGFTSERSSEGTEQLVAGTRVPIEAPANPYGKLGYPYRTRAEHVADLKRGIDKLSPTGTTSSTSAETLQKLQNRLGELPESKEQ